MILNKWNYRKHKYEPYKIPDNWNVKTYSEDMDELINCAQCGKKIKFGDGYTSLEVHTNLGIGYSVCDKCWDKEYLRKQD